MARRLIGLLCGLAFAIPVLAGPIHDRMKLVEAIGEVRRLGFDVAFSSQLVEDWMLVRETPVADEPIAALREALAVYDLDVVPGPADKWLVVRAATRSRADEAAAVPTEHDTPAPAPAARPIEEITIVGSRHGVFDRRNPGEQFLTGDEIRLMPHIADDAFRALHRLPGVAANDFQAPFNLRGGALDEVKVQLDGLEVFEPFHMRTLYRPLSVIDPGIIDQAQLLSGGFTAEHGNYMSGVIDIETVRPDSAPVHELGVSFVSAFARSQGRFGGGRGSYFLSGRRGYLDLIAERVVDEGEELRPRYGDLYGKLAYDVSDRTDVSLQLLLSEDDVSFVDPNDGEDFHEDGRMHHVWLSATTEFASGLRTTNIAFTGKVATIEDGSQVNDPAENIQRYFDRDAWYSGIKSEWVFTPGDRQSFRFGGRYRKLTTDYDYRLNAVRRSEFVNNGAPFFVQRDILMTSDGEDAGLFGAWRVRAGGRTTLEFGLRWDRQSYGEAEDASQLSPRLNALFELGERLDLRIAWGEFHQPQAIQDLQVQDGDTDYYDAERAEHRNVGVRYTFASGIELQADLYDKRYRELRPRYENLLDVYEFAPESNFDRTVVAPDSGRAYGAELTLRSRGSASLDWWLSYSLAKVYDEFGAATIYRSWDQRHAATASLTWHGRKWSITAVGRYHSGWPRTPLVAEPVVDGTGNIVGVDVDLTRRNSSRFDSYSRVDLRASRRVPLERGSFEYYFEVFNVFNNPNQCCTSNHRLDIGTSVTVSPEFDDYLPFFPSFGFVWRFGPGAAD